MSEAQVEVKQKQQKYHDAQNGQQQQKKKQDDPFFIAMQAEQKKIQDQIQKLWDQQRIVSTELQALFPDVKNRFNNKNEAEYKQFNELKQSIKNIYDEIKQLNEAIGDKSDHEKVKFKSVEQLDDEIYRLEYEIEHNNLPIQKEKELKKQVDALEKLKADLPQLIANQQKRFESIAQRNQLYEQLKPLKQKEAEMLQKKEEQLKAFKEQNLEKEKVDLLIAEKKKQADDIRKQIEELKTQKDEIYKQFLVDSDKRRQAQQLQREENQKKYEASKAARAIVDQLKDEGVFVYEKEKNSAEYQISIPNMDYDPLAVAKGGLSNWLKTEIAKPQEVKKEVKEMTKQEQKKQRQLKKIVNVDLTIDAWMDDLKIKKEDIETVEQKKAVLQKIQSASDEELKKSIAAKLEKINGMIEELKKHAIKVELVELKPKVEAEQQIKK